MSLIFDGFKTREQAQVFATAVEKRFKLTAFIPEDRKASMEHDPFPFQLDGIIVHVERPSLDDPKRRKIESSVVASVRRYGGNWAGT